MTKWPLILAVLFACLQIAPVMLIFSFLIGVAHFGFVSGSVATPLSWISYFIFTVPAMVAFAAYRIRAVVQKRTDRNLTIEQSLVVVLPAIVSIHIAEAIITLYQFGDDTTTFITALLFAILSTIILTYLLSNPSTREVFWPTPIAQNIKKIRIWITVITLFLLCASFPAQIWLTEYSYYIGITSLPPSKLFPIFPILLLPFFVFFAKYLATKLAERNLKALLLTTVIVVILSLITAGSLAILLPKDIPQELSEIADKHFISGNYDKAIARYERILKEYPDFAKKNPNIQSRLGLSYLAEAQPYIDAYNNGKGDIYFDLSTEFLNKAISIYPQNLKAYIELGVVYSEHGDKSLAIETYRKGLELDLSSKDPKDVGMIYENFGLAYYDTNQLDNAIDSFRKAIQYDPKQQTIYINLGATYDKKKMFDESIKQYTIALQINPNDALAHNNLGYALAQKGNINDSIAEFNKALEIDPNLKIAKENLGRYKNK
ncbi:MAG: tetratricopeptide repeat protein [Candidatus Levybacteria bacterium]|nr:tetratricopeptide repeat protein [Candidatus Levybacteria bacterium]